MSPADAGDLILEILAEFEATKIRDRRIFLSEESIAIMVYGSAVDLKKHEFNCIMRTLEKRKFIKKEHKCGERRWQLHRLITAREDIAKLG